MPGQFIHPEFYWKGVKVIQSPFARSIEVTFDVRHNPRRRRKRYSVHRATTSKPHSYMLDGVLVVHPIIYEHMKKAIPDKI